MPSYATLEKERWWRDEIVTPEMRAFGRRLHQALGVPANHFGSKGNNVHLNGGHRSQAWIKNSKYCTNRKYATQSGLTADQEKLIAAFDITPATREQMLMISRNLDRVVRAGQLEEIVEWYGNIDGDRRVDGYNNIKNAFASSNISHLTHLHGRLDRRVLRDASVFDRIFNALMHGTVVSSEDVDMTPDETRMLRNVAEFAGAMMVGREKITGIADGPGDPHTSEYPNHLLLGVRDLEKRVAALEAKTDAKS